MFFVFKSLKIKHGNGMCCKVMDILSQKIIMLCFDITHTYKLTRQNNRDRSVAFLFI